MTQNFIAQTYGKSMNYTDIPNRLYKEYNVKKGLRNEDNTGVRIGLTRVADVVGYDMVDGVKTSIPGKLYYRGIELTDLVNGKADSHYGDEETCFLLLFGYLPNRRDLENFSRTLKERYRLPEEFMEKHLLRSPSKNLMNSLQQAVLTLYNYDSDPDNVDVYETLLKGINLIAKLPAIACYAYQCKIHCYDGASLVIHYPREDYSLAENILYMLRKDQHFTDREAGMLDTLLMVHADHGGGNNSAFTNVVISSTGTDIYSSMVGSIGSLKGPKHGGANICCSEMLEAVVKKIGYAATDEQIREMVQKILNKNFYDRSGLVYGLGHAVYTQTDPRAEILKKSGYALAKEKQREQEYEFLERFEEIAKDEVLKNTGKQVSNNVDFYSSFIYDMLDIPREMYTPLFVISRTVGWLAHNVENKLYDGRIMRPATKYVGNVVDYVPMEKR